MRAIDTPADYDAFLLNFYRRRETVLSWVCQKLVDEIEKANDPQCFKWTNKHILAYAKLRLAGDETDYAYLHAQEMKQEEERIDKEIAESEARGED